MQKLKMMTPSAQSHPKFQFMDDINQNDGKNTSTNFTGMSKKYDLQLA